MEKLKLTWMNQGGHGEEDRFLLQILRVWHTHGGYLSAPEISIRPQIGVLPQQPGSGHFAAHNILGEKRKTYILLIKA